MYDDVSIYGVTSLDLYPNVVCNRYYTQFLDDEFLCIPDQKLDIKTINEINVSLCISEYSVINTILGPKLIIHGLKNIKIVYTADNCSQSLHSTHWSIPFIKHILLEELLFNDCSNLINSLFIGLEGIFIKHHNCRCIDLSILYIICPNINDKYKNCNPCTNSCYYNKNYTKNINYCDSNSGYDLYNCNTRCSNYSTSTQCNTTPSKASVESPSHNHRNSPAGNEFTRKNNF